MKNKTKHNHWLKPSLIKVAKLHLLFVFVYSAQIVAYDAAKLITPDTLLKRWFAVGLIAMLALFVWYMASGKAASLASYKILTWMIILSDVAFAAFNVYTQRGMASRAVVLFLIPIIVATILHSRVALIVTGLMSVIVYTTTSVAYFVNYFNEGYKIELYGEIFFYSAVMLIISGLLWVALKSKRTT